MARYSISPRTRKLSPRTRKYVKGYKFLSFARILSNKYRIILLDTSTKTRLGVLKNASKKVAHKTAEAAGESIGNKITGKSLKPKLIPDENSTNLKKWLFHQKKMEH